MIYTANFNHEIDFDMRKILNLLILLFTFGNAFSQFADLEFKEKKTYGSVIKISPLQFMWGTVPLTGEYGFSYEYKVGVKSTIEAKAAYVTKGLLFLMIESTMYGPNDPHLTMNGVRLQADYRFYPLNNEAPKGLFVAPLFSFATVNFSDEISKQSGYYLKATHFEFAVIAGYQFIFGNMALEPHIGVKYRDISWIEKSYQGITVLTKDEIADIYSLNSPVMPMFGISFGRAN